MVARTPARDLPLPVGELTDLLTGRVSTEWDDAGAEDPDAAGDGDGVADSGGGLSAVPQRSQ
ncbi:hypothetical protein GCM10022224_029580 [Nonomuraea antimicrobica]|uniref:Uncharacterized protein n=1 Tax=Nonomuraea antimicrobica TaxID=561173 RepID=A0ABP7BKN2_9ACTN